MKPFFLQGVKPQLILMSSVMVQMPRRAESCTSVLRPTLFCPEGDDPATEWQCCSSDDPTAAEGGERHHGEQIHVLYA